MQPSINRIVVALTRTAALLSIRTLPVSFAQGNAKFCEIVCGFTLFAVVCASKYEVPKAFLCLLIGPKTVNFGFLYNINFHPT
jgi:hypothetical protein